MKYFKFCENILNNRNVDNSRELYPFLLHYVKLHNKEDKSHLIKQVMILILYGAIDIKYVIKRYVELHDKHIVSVIDKNGFIINSKIYDN